MQIFEHNTHLQDESAAYPNGGQTRKGMALFPDGAIRRVYAGIPDTFFSIPAHSRIKKRYVAGYVTVDDGLDSATRGALLFHPYKKYQQRETTNETR